MCDAKTDASLQDFREAIAARNREEELNQDAFDKIWEKLRVMGRSTPLDKHLLVTGLQASKSGKERQTVAVTGDGTPNPKPQTQNLKP
jgi:magnesium-transporting ATPase (P-type)